MSRRRSKPKPQRLAEQVHIALEVRELYEHPTVQDHFKTMRDELVRGMVLCNATDDEGRRGYALQLQALDTLENSLRGRMAEGTRAANALSAMEQNDNE